MSETASSSFGLLDNRVQKWIWKQDWTSLRDIQENSIPPILGRDSDVIISASTAGGKTEAAFLPIISSILNQENGGSGYQVLYISPLKALINDQYRRLEGMLKGLHIDVIPWHGDVAISRKRKSLKNPNGIIIITPESLESFFVNRKQYLGTLFSNLSYIVIDELHSFIGSERGKQLQSLLSRVENITKCAVPRIAMSATFSDYEIVKKYLRNSEDLPCIIPTAGESNHEIKILIKGYLTGKDRSPDDTIALDMYTKLRGDNNLIFANSRVDVEKFASLLVEICENNFVPNEFCVHHGNLSKSERETVEQNLQKGDFPISAVCTSTLELGVDIGKVKSIVQIGAANSVSALRQRLGRSGRRGEASILKIYSIDNDKDDLDSHLKINLIQNIAVIERLRKNQYEKTSASSYHFSTLIQQILSILCQFGGFQAKEGWLHLCQKGAFKNVSSQMFLELLRTLGESGLISQTHSGEIIIGIEGEKIVKSQKFYVAFQTTTDYTLINVAKHKPIGSLQYVPSVGGVVILGGRKWSVISIDDKAKKIFATQVKQGSLPFFTSDAAEIDMLIVKKMKEVYNSTTAIPYLDSYAQTYLADGRAFFATNNLQTANLFIYGGKSLLMTWLGQKVNRTISLILALIDGRERAYNYIAIESVSSNDLTKLKRLSKPSPSELAVLVHHRKNKEFQKYDYLLSDNLLDLEYANSYLDIEEAWRFILALTFDTMPNTKC